MQEELSFGIWLRKQRREMDLSRQAFANQVGCAEVTLRRIEAGTLKPSKELANILLEKLGIPETERPQWISFARGLSEFPSQSPTPLNKPITNLPALLTSFIGREKEQVEVIRLITKYRLVTLTGSGGVGKTRLAIKVGEQVLENYAEGVWLLELASLNDPALLPQTAAALFGFTTQPDIPYIDLIINFLRPKSTLLILDNCEHLIDECAHFTDTLLRNCSQLKIVATSREPLAIPGEAIYRVPALAFPNLQQQLDNFRDFESLKLFEERAQLVQFHFSLTLENASSVAQICHRLDGIPLAIELAAAKIEMLSPEHIAKQLDQSFNLLTGGSRIALPRHQTLRASMNWSWSLLTEPEQMLMRQLSVFAGGWNLESARAVCSHDIVELNHSLVKKSLIVLNQEAGRGTRYHFHEAIRQYAHEKLVEAGEEAGVYSRHLEYYLRLSEQAETGLIGPEQVEWYDRMVDERDNLRVALEWALNTDPEAGMLLATNLGGRFWDNFDGREGLRWLTKFLQIPDSNAQPKGRAKALNIQAGLLRALGKLDLARAAADESLALCRVHSDQLGEIDVLLLLGELRGHQENLAGTEELHKALAQARSIGDVWRQARVLGELGWSQPDFQQALASWEEATRLFRQVGDWHNLVVYLGVLANSLISNDEIESARKYLEEASTLTQQLKGKTEMASILTAYGRIALIEGDFEGARTKFQECAVTADELGNHSEYVWTNTLLGYVALRERNKTAARDYFYNCLREFHAARDVEGLAYVMEAVAILFSEVGQLKRSARLIGWTTARHEERGYRRPKLEQEDVDKVILACIAKLGKAAFSEVYEEGKQMSLDEAVAYALKD